MPKIIAASQINGKHKLLTLGFPKKARFPIKGQIRYFTRYVV